MNQRTLVMTLVVSLAIPCAALGADWILVDNNDYADYYVDITTINKKGEKVYFWDQVKLKEVDTVQNKPYDRMMVFNSTNCKDRRVTSIEASFYYKKAHVLGGSALETKTVRPESAGKTVYDFVCAWIK